MSVATMALGGFLLIGYVYYAYVILWLCMPTSGWARRLAIKHVLSYAVYLYVFPIRLLMTAYGLPRLGFLPYLGTTSR